MVRAIILWALHNRLIVLLGVIVLIGFGTHAAYQPECGSLSRPHSAARRNHYSECRCESRRNGTPDRHSYRDGTHRYSGSGRSSQHLNRRAERYQMPVFAYGTDYWGARQEVINRINSDQTIFRQGVTPRLSPWSPTGEIVRYVLEGPGYTTKQLKARTRLGFATDLEDGATAVIDVTGYRR